MNYAQKKTPRGAATHSAGSAKNRANITINSIQQVTK